MAAATGTLASGTSYAGVFKTIRVTFTPTTASDTVTLTAATHGLTEITDVVPRLLTGFDAALAGIFATFSGLVVTVSTTAAAGTAATDWTGATAVLTITGKQ